MSSPVSMISCVDELTMASGEGAAPPEHTGELQSDGTFAAFGPTPWSDYAMAIAEAKEAQTAVEEATGAPTSPLSSSLILAGRIFLGTRRTDVQHPRTPH